MAAIFELRAQTRTVRGKGASRRLRREEQVPAVLYGAEKPAQSLTLAHGEVLKALQHEAFYSHILTLHIDGTPQQAVLKALQRHPYKPKIMHLDFLRVDSSHTIIMHVPLHFTGEDKAPGVKVDKGLLTKNVVDVEVRCLPAQLPEFINVDISELRLGQAIHLTELKLPAGVELAHKPEDAVHDSVVVSIHAVRGAEESEAVAVPSSAEVPTIRGEKAED
ncbi:MAG: 50S ribosomal protein L25/general stress protein Ctc [Gammaproteobacteria bacterium]